MRLRMCLSLSGHMLFFQPLNSVFVHAVYLSLNPYLFSTIFIFKHLDLNPLYVIICIRNKRRTYIMSIFLWDLWTVSGPGSVVGIATGYGLGRSGDRIPMGVRFSAPVQTGRGAYPAFSTACRGSRSIALPFHDHGTRRG